MSNKYILEELKGGLIFLTINRPEALNALNSATLNELECTIYRIKNEKDIRGAILVGAGQKSFVAGADIGELLELGSSESARSFMRRGQDIFSSIEGLGKPTIAAVNGFCLGGGLELAMACTIRVASTGAKFGQPEINLGIIPGYGGTQRLPRLVGKGRALELILTGKMIDAEEAYRIGLVNRVVEPDKLLEESEKIARNIISKGPLAVRAALEAVNAGLETSLSHGLLIEADLQGILFNSKDGREGLKAFIEKRSPKFKGE